MTDTLGSQTNTPLARSFQQIVTAGWANQSRQLGDTNVALIHIEPRELPELRDAVLPDVCPMPGNYVLVEDGDGNATVVEYLHKGLADMAFRDFATPPEKQFLVCDPCGEVFDTIETAHAHESRDDTSMFGHEYTIKPESEAF